MSEQLRTIRLYGKLGAQFGRVHRLAVESTQEAIQALRVLLPGFEREMMTSRDRGVVYAIFVGKKNINQDQLGDPTGGCDIRVAPVMAGSKRGGVLQTIVGAVLIVVGAVISFYGGGAGAPIMQAGMAMMAGGVIQMLSPQQKGVSAKDNPNNGASYNFNGPVNTSAQGNPVPKGYGRLIVGSAVASAGIYAQDQL
ncbi:tail assembly protein [Collimonas sp. NPDC087041]|uniref:tail assembly protein n=1 Tax=Collimonas sp. NPDC087041 TaxID=3363960 RepID=UPI003805DFAF